MYTCSSKNFTNIEVKYQIRIRDVLNTIGDMSFHLDSDLNKISKSYLNF